MVEPYWMVQTVAIAASRRSPLGLRGRCGNPIDALFIWGATAPMSQGRLEIVFGRLMARLVTLNLPVGNWPEPLFFWHHPWYRRSEIGRDMVSGTWFHQRSPGHGDASD